MTKSNKLAAKAGWKELTTLQQNFILNMLADPEFNASNAAKAAGYKAIGKAVHDLMSNKVVTRILASELKERAERLQFTADAVLQQLADILFLDPFEFCEPGEEADTFTVRNMADIPVNLRRLVTSFKCKTKTRTLPDGEEETDTCIDIRFMDKNKAMELAMKHFGLLDERLAGMLAGKDGSMEFFAVLLRHVEGNNVNGTPAPTGIVNKGIASPVIDADYIRNIANHTPNGT